MSKYKEECKKFLEDLPKMDKEFQENTLKRYKSLTSIILLNFGNNLEEYLEYKKDKASIDYYDICKALNLEPEDIRRKSKLLEELERRMKKNKKSQDEDSR